MIEHGYEFISVDELTFLDALANGKPLDELINSRIIPDELPKPHSRDNKALKHKKKIVKLARKRNRRR